MALPTRALMQEGAKIKFQKSDSSLSSHSKQSNISRFSKMKVVKAQNEIQAYLQAQLKQKKKELEGIETEKNKTMKHMQSLRDQSACIVINDKFYFLDKLTLGYFDQESKTRLDALKTVKSKYYEVAINSSVVLASIFIGLRDRQSKSFSNDFNVTISLVNFVFTLVFLMDSVLKIISYGLYKHNNAYLRDSFHILDLFLVVIGFISFSMQVQEQEGSFVEAISLLSLLRPLRLFNAYKSAKMHVIALIKAIPNFLSVGFFFFFFFFVYAVFGIQLFSDSSYYRCRESEMPVNATYWPKTGVNLFCNPSEKDFCGEGVYCGSPSEYDISLIDDKAYDETLVYYGFSDFDNFFVAFFAVYQSMTCDGWTQHMYIQMQANSSFISVVYFCSIIVVGNFVILALFLAVIIQSFSETIPTTTLTSEQLMVLIKMVIAKKFQDQRALSQRNRDILAIQQQEESNETEQQVQENAMEESKVAILSDQKLNQEVCIDLSAQLAKNNTQNFSDRQLSFKPQTTTKSILKKDTVKNFDKRFTIGNMHKQLTGGEIQKQYSMNSLNKKLTGLGFKKRQTNAENNQELEEVQVKLDQITEESKEAAENYYKKKTKNFDAKSIQNSEVAKHFQRPIINEQQKHLNNLRIQPKNNSSFFFEDNAEEKKRHDDLEEEKELQVKQAEEQKEETKRALVDRNGDSSLSYLQPEEQEAIDKQDQEENLMANFIKENKNRDFFELVEDLKQGRKGNSSVIEFKKADTFKNQPNAMKKRKEGFKTNVFRKSQTFVEEGSSPEAFKKNATLARQMKALMKVTTKKDFKVSMMVRNYQTLHTQATDLFAQEDLSLLHYSKMRSKQNKIFTFFFMITQQKLFNQFIQLCIFLNSIIMSLDRHPISQLEASIHEGFNQAFSAIFLLEFFIKVLGLGFRVYWQDFFNKFDCIIVLSSVLDTVLFYSKSGSGALVAIRAFRLLRIFKLARTWPMFRNLLATIVNTLKDMKAFGLIFIVFLYIFTLIGMDIFAYQVRMNSAGIPNNNEGPFADSNFNDFVNGFLIVFIILLNDGWFGIFYQHAKAVNHSYKAYIYFLSVIFIGRYLVFNLFMAILLRNFEADSKARQKKDFGEPESDTVSQHSNFQRDEIKKRKVIAKLMKGMSKSGENTQITKRRTFQDNIEGKSLYLFDSDSKIRILFCQIAESKYFENIITTLIILSTITLSIENPLFDPESAIALTFKYTDYIFTACFVLEAVIKIMAQGFVLNGKKSYLKNMWNILDFFIVICSLLDFAANSLKIFKVFRLIRAISPLKVVTKNEGFKIVLTSLSLSIKDIINGILITMLFFFIFSIMFVNLFKGKLNKCYQEGNVPMLDFYESEQQCLNYGGVWEINPYNYDSLPDSFMTLFHKQTTSNWAYQTYLETRAAPEIGQSIHKTEKTQVLVSLLSVCFMFVCTCFLLNVFIGIVITSFNRGKEQITRQHLLNVFQKQYLTYKEIVVMVNPERDLEIENGFRGAVKSLIDHKIFDKFIFITLIANASILCIKWYNMDIELELQLETVNVAFMAIYLLEFTLKFFSYRMVYFQNNWNRLDFTAIAISLIAFICGFFLARNNIGIKIMKAFRIVRLLRLIRRIHPLRVILYAILNSASKLFNVGGILIIFFFIFSVLGNELFATTKISAPLDEEFVNFKNIGNAFLVLLRSCTGEAWPDMLAALGRERSLTYQCEAVYSYESYKKNGFKAQTCGSAYTANIFYFFFIVIVNQMFLNLFIAVTLQGFEETSQLENQEFSLSRAAKFATVWTKFDPQATGFIPKEYLNQLLFSIGAPLGWEKSEANKKASFQENFIQNLELSLYNDFKDYQFHNVLESISKRMLVQQAINNFCEEQNRDSNTINSQDKELKDFINFKKDEIHDLDMNYLKIQTVEKVHQKLAQKSKGAGMFDVITHKELVTLQKFVYQCKKKIVQKKRRVFANMMAEIASLQDQIIEPTDLSSRFQNLQEKQQKSQTSSSFRSSRENDHEQKEKDSAKVDLAQVECVQEMIINQELPRIVEQRSKTCEPSQNPMEEEAIFQEVAQAVGIEEQKSVESNDSDSYDDLNSQVPTNRTHADFKGDLEQKAVMKRLEPEPENLKKVSDTMFNSREAASDQQSLMIRSALQDPRNMRDQFEEQKQDDGGRAQYTQDLGSSYSKQSAIGLSRVSSIEPAAKPAVKQAHPISFFQSRVDTKKFSESGQDEASVQFNKKNLRSLDKQSTITKSIQKDKKPNMKDSLQFFHNHVSSYKQKQNPKRLFLGQITISKPQESQMLNPIQSPNLRMASFGTQSAVQPADVSINPPSYNQTVLVPPMGELQIKSPRKLPVSKGKSFKMRNQLENINMLKQAYTFLKSPTKKQKNIDKA